MLLFTCGFAETSRGALPTFMIDCSVRPPSRDRMERAILARTRTIISKAYHLSRKLFGTDGIRGIAGEPPLDERTAHALGVALGEWARHASAAEISEAQKS